MRRFFVEPQQLKQGQVTITGQDAKHLGKVLRLESGDEIQVFDGSGTEYLVKLLEVKPAQAVGQIIEEVKADSEPPIKVSLVQALPKQGKMELIVQKCTELGVTSIYPLETTRSVVKLAGAKGKEKAERWQKVAIEAVKQCGRSKIPLVFPPQTLDSFLQYLSSANNNDLSEKGRSQVSKEIIMLWEGEATQGFKQVLNRWEEEQVKPELFILIGPEGGFAVEEVDKVLAWGGHVAGLGPRILRTETAGLVALSNIMYHLGDLGG